MWFETLTGFREDDVDEVAAQFVVDGSQMTSLANGRVFEVGHFDTPSLGELRQQATAASTITGSLRLGEVVADVRRLHVDPANAGALFQVASQFNTLEMSSPSVTPEMGISRYHDDRTQGPACAISCAAATIYRNHLVPIGGEVGQRSDRQIDCLADLAAALGVEVTMRNGYALPGSDVLAAVAQTISTASTGELEALRSALRIGVHADTEVTMDDAGHTVTQAFCSAMPVAYSPHSADEWEPFARLVLEAAYEATLAAAVVNAARTGNNSVFLTMLGGGVFGNRPAWILHAIERSLELFADRDLEVLMVSHGAPNPALQPLLDRFGQ